MPQQQSAAMQQCIDLCLACYSSCQQTALMHCLDLGNAHVEPAHFRLMADCANACRTAAEALRSSVAQHDDYCRACADLCRECAARCAALGDMDDCVQHCRRCADACDAMVRMTLDA